MTRCTIFSSPKQLAEVNASTCRRSRLEPSLAEGVKVSPRLSLYSFSLNVNRLNNNWFSLANSERDANPQRQDEGSRDN